MYQEHRRVSRCLVLHLIATSLLQVVSTAEIRIGRFSTASNNEQRANALEQSHLASFDSSHEPLNRKQTGSGHLSDNTTEESHEESDRGYHDGNEYDSHPVHVATYATNNGVSNFNPLTVIALTVFSVLSLLILLQLLGVQTTFRSNGAATSLLFSLPFEWNFSTEVIPEVMTTIIGWIEKADRTVNGGTFPNVDEQKSRPKRDMSQTPSLSEWLRAYRKDPYEYECLRKLACETLAHSSLVSKSVKSKLGSTIMSSVKFLFEDGTMLVETIKDALRDPDKCKSLFTENMCDDPELSMNLDSPSKNSI